MCGAAALTGCQGVTTTRQYAQVRFIEASPDTPPVDVYQNSSPILYNVGFGTASSYIPVTPGAYTYSVDTAGLHQQLGKASGTFAAGGQYTILVGNTAAALQTTLLRDQLTPPPAGQFALRVLHQATRSGALDLYLVPPGGKLAATQPFASGVTFGSSPGYALAPAGTYALVAVPAGTSPAASPVVPLYTGSQFDSPGGSSRTIVLIDPSAPSIAALQALTTSDSD